MESFSSSFAQNSLLKKKKKPTTTRNAINIYNAENNFLTLEKSYYVSRGLRNAKKKKKEERNKSFFLLIFLLFIFNYDKFFISLFLLMLLWFSIIYGFFCFYSFPRCQYAEEEFSLIFFFFLYNTPPSTSSVIEVFFFFSYISCSTMAIKTNCQVLERARRKLCSPLTLNNSMMDMKSAKKKEIRNNDEKLENRQEFQ